jgi:RNA polymerase sigma-70 factor, ECF subfamily
MSETLVSTMTELPPGGIDKATFVALLREHDRAMRAVAYSIVMDATIMDDVLQESYLKAFRSLDHFWTGSSFRSWLCQIVRNTAIDEIRRKKSLPLDESLELESLDVAIEESVAVRLSVTEALAKLPEVQRVAIRLVDGEQLPYADVAEMLGVPIGTLASRVATARSTLRSLLKVAEKEAP